jgi:hypothetical protein
VALWGGMPPHSRRNKSLTSMTVPYFPQADGQVVEQNVYNGLRGVFLLLAHQAQKLYRTGNLQLSVTTVVLRTIKERAVHLPHVRINC